MIEVAARGPVRDLEVQGGARRSGASACQARTETDPDNRMWVAELAVSLQGRGDAAQPGARSPDWRINFVRTEGAGESPPFSSWVPMDGPWSDSRLPMALGHLVLDTV